MRTFIYVDGFNLYYRAVRDTPFKWLDLDALCRILLPRDDIQRIKYFTARIIQRPGDPTKNIRQEAYLRALRTLPNLEIIYGHYSEHVKWMRLANPTTDSNPYVEVIRTEEKGSDVNLAVHLLNDGYQRKYELAVLITNDSDLLSAIQVVQKELGLKVGILNPHIHPSSVLEREALFIKTIQLL